MSERIRVLHVEDDPEFADLAATLLEREDDRFTVETAHDAEEGLDRLAPAIDCIVSDYDMPGMDGLAFLDEVRETYPDLPFVLFTGKGSEEVASEAISAGVTDYLQKEVGSDQFAVLANRLTNAVEKHRLEREADRTRDRLERQNDLFEKTQSLAGVGAWEYDVDAGELFVTDETARIHGLPPTSDPTPDEFLACYEAENRPQLRKGFEQACEDDEPYDRTLQLTTVEGETRWVRARGEPQYEGGQLARIRGTIQDVTERKERERRLERSKQRYRTLLKTAPDAIFVADAETGEIVETNEAATRLLDKPREEILGIHQTELHPPEKAQEYADLFEEHVAESGGRAASLGDQLDLYVVNADGERIPVEINARLSEIDGKPVVQGFFRDITERRERERKLQRERDRVNALFENMAEPIAYYEFEDGDPITKEINPAFEETFGITDEEARGRKLDDIVVPEKYLEEGEGINERVRAGEIVDTEVVREAGEEVRTFTLLSVPLSPGESGKRGFAVYSDVTERKERERELQRRNEQLEDLMSVMSHDLRNPLRVLEGSLDLVAERTETDELDRCFRAVDRIDQLIENLLTLARQGSRIDERERVDLADVADACWNTVETGEADITVEADRTLRADESRLKQLLENLIRNAVEHGGEDVTVTVGTLQDGDGFYVEDDGPGIPETNREKVFDVGFSPNRTGTGFGLAIVARIVEAHGWEITATESDDGGARFEITGVDVEASIPSD